MASITVSDVDLYSNPCDFFIGGGASNVAVASGGSGGCTPSTFTTASTENYKPFTIDVKYEEDNMSECQFCGEPKIREITEKKFVKGQWKTRTTCYYKCGTSKTIGTYKVKNPRERIGKGCVGFRK